MTVYTVHEPRPRKSETATDADRFVFVRDGFYFWAFVLGPIWILWHRLWLVLLAYIVGSVVLQAVLWILGVSGVVKFAVGVLISLLVGFEAASLRRWTFARRKWKNLGVVVGEDVEAAERRFFDTWVVRNDLPPQPAPMASSPPPVVRMPAASPEVIGLFPEPETHR
jgi:hypothetical protein